MNNFGCRLYVELDTAASDFENLTHDWHSIWWHVPSKKAASRSEASVALRIFPPLASIRHTCCLISVTNIPTRGQGGQGGKKSRHHVPRHCCCLCRTLQDPCRGASTCSASCTHRPPPSRSGLHMSHIEKCVFLFFVFCVFVWLCICSNGCLDCICQ